MTEYAMGTCLVERVPYGGYARGRAVCSDGKVRAVQFPSGGHADTFFSVPATVHVSGMSVSGFIMVETVEGLSTATDADPAVVKFIAYSHRKNGGLLPPGSWRRS